MTKQITQEGNDYTTAVNMLDTLLYNHSKLIKQKNQNIIRTHDFINEIQPENSIHVMSMGVGGTPHTKPAMTQ